MFNLRLSSNNIINRLVKIKLKKRIINELQKVSSWAIIVALYINT